MKITSRTDLHVLLANCLPYTTLEEAESIEFAIHISNIAHSHGQLYGTDWSKFLEENVNTEFAQRWLDAYRQ